MKILFVLPLLCCVCTLVHSACDIVTGALRDKDFPDIEKKATESFIMSVEFTLTNLAQTDYYMEYYDMVERQGRVEGHYGGKSHTYLYKTQNWESWEITEDTCKLTNVSKVPELWGHAMNEWLYDPEDNERRVFGPSAMFKRAFDVWKSTERTKYMAYMGKTEFLIRGLRAQYWRRCDSPNSYVDYFFTTDDEEDPLGLGQKAIPLRVVFGGERPDESKTLSDQQYEVITFQPFIPSDMYPFEIPTGKGCSRYPPKKNITNPDFSKDNLLFNAEVIYRKIDRNGDSAEYWSYYSNLVMALDLKAQHLAYYYTPWNASKPDSSEEPTVLSPEYVIYDMKNGYAYKNNVTSGECQIIRQKSFIPKYKLPGNAGELALTDPTILYPNSEMIFMAKGINRGLRVNIFEEVVENYILDNSTADPIPIPKAIITHSYLQDNEVERNTVSVENAFVQVKVLLMGRYPKVTEEITLNFFGFTTQIFDKMSYFNTLKCFKNDDDYVWVTIGFSADDSQIERIRNDVPSIQSNILNSIQSESELNPVRIPIVLVDFKEGVYVTLLILGKPPVMLDYLEPEKRKKITGATDLDGVQEPEVCAQKCLETETNCWGFSICGGLCAYGTKDAKVVAGENDCKLYKRYNNGSYIPSKEKMVEDIQKQVQTNDLRLVLKATDGSYIQLESSSVEVTDPGEDDSIFTRIGNEVNPRMRVFKAGSKLKEAAGKPVRNLGKLRFDECQRVCLDFKDCETVSYCMKTQECIASSKFGEDIDKNLIETDDLCSIVTRSYGDNFERSPGLVLSVTAQEVLPLATVEECARACLKASGYQCLSFDHCPKDPKSACKLHTVHYPTSKTREKIQERSTNCGHYYRKFSTEFKKNPNRQTIGASLTPLFNMTLEECSKACKEYGKGTCFGFDFCQAVNILATTCTLLDSDPSQLKSRSSDQCTNYLRGEPEFAPRPYSNGYAGGIGFLVFMIGLVVGAVVVFGIAYIKINRR